MSVLHASAVRLDSGVVVAVIGLVALGLVALVPCRWDAWRHRRTGRAVTTLLAVGGVVVGCAAAANLLGGFYPTLGSLLGSSGNPGEGTVVDIGDDGAGLSAALTVLTQRSAAGHGSTLHLVLHGVRSGITRDADVYLPAGYATSDRRYPVVEWLPGFPGEPREIAALFGVPDLVDTAIAAHRMPPVVVIIPDTNGEPRFGHDQECVDAEHGPADDTYLSADLRAWATATLRVRTDREAWAVAGWSSGGYCAMNLALRHPETYGIALSQSGYDHPPHDLATGDLFGGRADLEAANDVETALRAGTAPLALLVAAGADEDDEQAATARVRAAAGPTVRLDVRTFPGGGHNQNAVRSQLPALVDWLGAQLPWPRAGDAAVAARVADPAGIGPRALPQPDQ